MKQPSYGTSRSNSMASITSRQLPSNNFASSQGPGSKAFERSKTSMSNSRSVIGRPKTANSARPQTAFGHRNDADLDAGSGQHNGTTQFSINLQRQSLHNKVKAAKSTTRFYDGEDLTLIRRFSQMGIHDDLSQDLPHCRNQAVSLHFPSVTTPTLITTNMNNVTTRPRMRVSKQLAKSVGATAVGIEAPPWTPTLSLQLGMKMASFEETLKSATKTINSPSKTPTPAKPPFLNKYSNLTAYVGWDVDGRLDEVESQFKGLKEMMSTTLSDRKAMEDAIDLAKTRGRSWA
jgi:kinesin family member C1